MAGVLATKEAIAATNDNSGNIIKSLYLSDKSIYFLILVSIVLSYYGPYLAYTGLKEVSFYRVTQIAIAPFLVFIPVRLKREDIYSNKSFIFLVLFVLYASISALWSADHPRSVYYVYLLFSSLFIALLISLFLNHKMVKIVIYGMLAAVLLNFSIVPFEVLLDFHLPYSLINTYAKLANLPSGFYANPNDLGTVLVMVTPFFAFIFLWKRELQWLAVLCLLVSVAALFFTGSRGGWLGFLFANAGVFILYFKKFKKRFYELAIGIAIIVFFFALLLTALPISDMLEFLPGKVLSKIEAFNIEGNQEKFVPELNSLNLRLKVTLLSIKSLKINPFGLGPGMSDAFVGKALFHSGIYNPHNMWGETAINYGIPGLSLFVLFYVSLLVRLYKVFHSTYDSFARYLAAACFISMVGFIISSLSPSSVWRSFPVMWTIFGLALYAVKYDRNVDLT